MPTGIESKSVANLTYLFDIPINPISFLINFASILSLTTTIRHDKIHIIPDHGRFFVVRRHRLIRFRL